MTVQEAERLGYAIVKASPFEIGLTKNGAGLRTWFYDMSKGLPGLDHPEVQKHIMIQEEYERETE